MADPTKYQPSYSFSGWQANNPTRPLPAPRVDDELANISASLGGTIDALADIRRSDGGLVNGVVGPDALSPALTIGFKPRGNWAPDVLYYAGDGVTFDNAFYSAREMHTSTADDGPPNPDLWLYLFSISEIQLQDGSVTTPKLADGSVTLVKMAALVGPTLLGRVEATGAPVALTPEEARTATGIPGLLETKLDKQAEIVGISRITRGGMDNVYAVMNDGSSRAFVANLMAPDNTIGFSWDGPNGIPHFRIDGTIVPLASRGYAEALASGRVSAIRSIDVGWTRPTASSGDFYAGASGVFGAGFQMGQNGFVGVFWRQFQYFVNGSWTNVA